MSRALHTVSFPIDSMGKKNNVILELSIEQQPMIRNHEQRQEHLHIGLRGLYCSHKIVSFISYIISLPLPSPKIKS